MTLPTDAALGKRVRHWLQTRCCAFCHLPLVVLDRSANPRACFRCWARVEAAERERRQAWQVVIDAEAIVARRLAEVRG